EWVAKGEASLLGAAAGAVAGLVAITPAAGNVGIPGAFAIGLGVGLVCLWGVTGLKRLIRADDSLDVFGVHAIGGIFGALMTGIFNAPALGGPGSVDWATGAVGYPGVGTRSEEHTSELQSLAYLVCRLLLEKKKHIAILDAQAHVPHSPNRRTPERQ